jgi:ankyrin repeat protein
LNEGKFSISVFDFLTYFSEKDVLMNKADDRQRTPLHIAAFAGHIGVLEGLIQAGADMNLQEKDNCTPLCLAIREG